MILQKNNNINVLCIRSVADNNSGHADDDDDYMIPGSDDSSPVENKNLSTQDKNDSSFFSKERWSWQ